MKVTKQQEEAKKQNPFKELGVEGVKISSGFVHDEFLLQLIGDKGRRIYREMRDNDAIISTIIFAIEMLLRAVEWSVSTNAEGSQAEEAVTFIEGALFDDMSHTWDDFIGNVTTMLTFGWQYTEVVYKLRNGPDQADPSRRSIFNDGHIGIRKLADRSQETLDRWSIAEDGSILGMWQMPPNGGAYRFIPIERALLFRPHQHKGSPEGRSALRGAYRSWYIVKNIQEVEGIAIERELNGLPVVYVPGDLLAAQDSQSRATVELYKKLVRDIKFNEQAGVILPSDVFFDADGKLTNNRKVMFELVSAKGSRAIDTDKVVKRYQADIARTVLADFVMLGITDRGSFALSRSKVDLFARALEGWLEAIAKIINRHLITRLWALNGFDRQYMPYLVPGRVAPEDLEEIGGYISNLARAGFPLAPDDDLENRLRDIGGLPEKPVNEEGFNDEENRESRIARLERLIAEQQIDTEEENGNG